MRGAGVTIFVLAVSAASGKRIHSHTSQTARCLRHPRQWYSLKFKGKSRARGLPCEVW
jgi:hypothetical protein